MKTKQLQSTTDFQTFINTSDWRAFAGIGIAHPTQEVTDSVL
jgi:hypothetical protein